MIFHNTERPRRGHRRARPTFIRPGSRAGLALTAAAVVAAAGCDAGGGGDFMVRDSAGTRIAVSRAPAWGNEAVWRLTAPSVVMGSPVELAGRDGDRTRITGAWRLPGGRVLVMDEGALMLRLYGPEGGLLGTAGGAGREPGEYRSLQGFAVLDDSLWVFDPFLGRVSVLDSEGRYIRYLRLEPTGDPALPLRQYRLAGATKSGRLVLATGTRGGEDRESLLYTRHGLLADQEVSRSARLVETVGATPGALPPVLAHDRLYHTGPGPAEVTVHDLGGGARTLIRLMGGPGTKVGRRVVVSEQERLWVEKPAGSGAQPSDWLVFDADGRWLGVVESPRDPDITRFEIHQVGPWGLLAVWRVGQGPQQVGIWPFTS